MYFKQDRQRLERPQRRNKEFETLEWKKTKYVQYCEKGIF